ncbi:membrane associated rhomboid family serine protease [Luteibacter rhizovicinus]|uniref:Membrane associated rhomboid family serine protease n=1 Tax=Luteibacter rhizovicinus TaxID=242606 RepID=A0A4V2W3C3_9GAMM|nr:rhomboid family intramembrane serine protease [Luteibacter rhizovicinus]TCV91439.1 membrane associated rhomboid family serine protease [Luteibacter rhizovicinus]
MHQTLAPVTRNLLIANILIFGLQLLLKDDTTAALTRLFALWPLGPDIALRLDDGSVVSAGFRLWQIVTYAFMHGGMAHIVFNMFGLYMFGSMVERELGARRFAIYYFTCLIAAGVAQLAVVYFFEPDRMFPTVGASGAIFGLLGAFAMRFPREKLMLIPIPIGIPAWLFVTGYGVAELAFGVTGTMAGVAHFAHLGGLLGGIVLMRIWRDQLPRRY